MTITVFALPDCADGGSKALPRNWLAEQSGRWTCKYQELSLED